MSEINYGKVLVVEDDFATRETIRVWLSKSGFKVILAADGPQGLQAQLTERPDIIVLDIMLPGLDGYEICRRIRGRSNVPILMLSAQGEATDRILGLELGADDFLPKPFEPKELVARIRARLRGRKLASEEPSGPDSYVEYGTIRLNSEAHTVFIGDDELSLTKTEFGILHLLIANAGAAMSREKIITLLFGDDFEGEERTIDSHVRNLRAKLKKAGFRKGLVESVWGVGYKLPRKAKQ